MEIETTIEVLEVNGQEREIRKPHQSITVQNHWNRNEWVVLGIGRQKLTVSANDLERAIQNARNHK